MARAGKPKRTTKAETARKRSVAAKKAARTRAANRAKAEALARKRSRAAKKAAETRRRNKVAAIERELRKRRSTAAKKGAAKRRAKARAALALTAMLNAAAAGADAATFNELRPEWHDAKWELYDAVDEDRDAYLALLDDLAEECDTDWQIAYGPAEE